MKRITDATQFLALFLGLALVTDLGLPVGTFKVKSPESFVEFFVKDNRGGFGGVARDVDSIVTVRANGADAYVADVTATIDTRTIRTGLGLRDGQMRSARFLNTNEFPFILFNGHAVADQPSERQFSGALKGQLTIRNVTREVEVPLSIIADEGEYLAQGEVIVRMTDFSIPIPRFLFFVAEDPVTVRFQVRLRSEGQAPPR